MWSSLAHAAGSFFGINPATLSGCMDIVVVSQNVESFGDDVENPTARLESNISRGTFRGLKSSSFHVRFGKSKLLWPNQRKVYLFVNGTKVPVSMVLDSEGVAYFDNTPKKTIQEPNSGFQDTFIDKESYLANSRVSFSLAGHLLGGNEDTEAEDLKCFQAHRVSYDQMNNDASLWYHPYLVACFNNRRPFFPGRVALPLIASWLIFDRPLTSQSLKLLMETDLTLSTSTKQNGGNSDFHVSVLNKLNEFRKDPARSFTPTSEQLESMNLQFGPNSLWCVVYLNGVVKTVCSTIYFWSPETKIVVSDIDGTITKSDIMGHLMPIFGKDWVHDGIVGLYSKIHNNGYQFLFLTARAIGQADNTRDYLFSLKDSENTLPEGPLLMSPDRLFDSFKREVLDQATYDLKVSTLNEVRDLFPENASTFHAGFGNRHHDHRAYVHAGIPENMVFIVDTKGKLSNVDNHFPTYKALSEHYEGKFPPVNAHLDVPDFLTTQKRNFIGPPSEKTILIEAEEADQVSGCNIMGCKTAIERKNNIFG